MQQNQRTNQPTALGDLFHRATENQAKAYNQKQREVWIPTFARFKLQFIYHGGAKSKPYHSFDVQYRYKHGIKTNIVCEDLGLTKLLKLVDSERGNYFIAQIWCKLGSDLRTSVMDYDYTVFKHVNAGKQKPFLKKLKFDNGRLDTTALHVQRSI